MLPEELDTLVRQAARFTGNDSAAWTALAKLMRARVDVLRDTLEVESDVVKCAELRGEIRAFRFLLALPVQVTQVETAGPDTYIGDENW